MKSNTTKEETIIRPPSKVVRLDLRELYKYRHMLWSMVWRDIRLQFDEIYLGFFWAVARPLAMVLIFTLLKRFSNANMSETISYPLYAFSGLIFWFYFLEATTATMKSVSKDAGLIKKIYFPRLITPIVPTISNLSTLGLAMIPLLIMMIWNGVYPGWRVIFLPLVIFQCLLLIMGVGTMFASLSLTNKDFEKFLNLVLYLGLFISPVIYSPEMIPSKAQVIYFLNPMAGTLLAFRSCMFNDFPFPFLQWGYSVAFSFVILIVGTTMYRRAEVYFADKL